MFFLDEIGGEDSALSPPDPFGDAHNVIVRNPFSGADRSASDEPPSQVKSCSQRCAKAVSE